jgi:hypothetical protein
VRFTHLEAAYRDAAWVRVDGDDVGKEIVERLRERYSTWDPSRFGTFNEPQFELYYPASFSDRVTNVLAEPDKRVRREAKRRLLEDVRAWLDEDEERARDALSTAAAPVIAFLQEVEASAAATASSSPPAR